MTSFSQDFSRNFSIKWDQIRAAAISSRVTLPDDAFVRKDLEKVLVYSDFVAQSFVRNPGMLSDFVNSGDLSRQYTAEEYMGRVETALVDVSSETELGSGLRLLRNREMVRIAWRDLLGWADLEETLINLSWLAEACLENSFSFLLKRHCLKFGTPLRSDGTPQNMVVLGMGKLGAWELNFSSDLDLIFSFPEAGETDSGPRSLTHEEFFLGLARNLLKVFSLKGPEGILFRVDMRLRPFGESGSLVMSFNAMLEYYQRYGSEWERYAMIKARPVAGDKEAGRELLQKLQPFVYRRYLDYGVYDSLREMKKKISLEVVRRGFEDNIKLGAGGIREIEFFGQMFQLVRGGVETELRERRILEVLARLVQGKYISREVGEELTAAYRFLRLVENRLQEFRDQQTHTLPTDQFQRYRLSVSMGFDDWASFMARLETHLRNVHFQFDELLVRKDERQENEDSTGQVLYAVWQGLAEETKMEEALLAAGYKAPGEVTRILDYLRNDFATRSLSSQGRGRLDRLMPLVLKQIGISSQPELVLTRIIDLIKAIEQRTNYLSLLIEKPSVLTHLIKLASASPWIITFLARHPLLLDELIDPRTLYSPPEKDKLEKMLNKRLSRLSGEDLEMQLEELIIFKNVNTLHVAAADVFGAFLLMKVSDYLSEIAEMVVTNVMELSWKHLVEKYGEPVSHLESSPCTQGFAVVAYGKLGGLELGYSSDLDLVFLHAALTEQTGEPGEPVYNPQFFSRLGQRAVHLLSARTRAGRLYQIDMRLRPSGNAGILVSNIEAFKDYQINQAWTWEHQALIKARFICGDKEMGAYFEKIRREVLTKYREKNKLLQDIRSMRDRMRKEQKDVQAGLYDVKRGYGGIIDIEFLVQYLVLLYAHEYNELTRWTDNVRLLDELDKAGIMADETAQILKKAYLIYRSEVHRLSLQEKPAVIAEDKFIYLRTKVKKIWDSYFQAGNDSRVSPGGKT